MLKITKCNFLDNLATSSLANPPSASCAQRASWLLCFTRFYRSQKLALFWLTVSRKHFNMSHFANALTGNFTSNPPSHHYSSPLPPRVKWVFWWLSTRKLAPVCVGRHLWWTRPSTRWDPSDYCEVELRCSITEGAACQLATPFISLPSPCWCYSDYGRPRQFLPLAPVGAKPP